jgi:hypothetical protein
MGIDDFKKHIEIIVLLVGLPVAIYQLFLLVKQLKLSATQIKEQTDWNRKNVTFEYINEYTRELKDINKQILDEIISEKSNGGEISTEKLEQLMEDSTFRADIMRIVAYFDNLSLGIKNNYFDNQIAQDSLIVIAIETYRILKPYINLRRKETNVNVASNFENLYYRWKGKIVVLNK